MRLWHQDLISRLPRQQLLGQHRECCALRGKGWGKKHSVVNYVFQYPMEHLIAYHFLIMHEMEKRGYNIELKWWSGKYRGLKCNEYDFNWEIFKNVVSKDIIYQEHDKEYLEECLSNLKGKGIII
jgi:uncharacterized protein (TIGR02328 family)